MSAISKVIQTTSISDKVAPLYPGELGYSYKSKTLFIGPDYGDANNVISLLTLDTNSSNASQTISNNPLSIIIQSIAADLTDKVPSARAIAQQLLKKASLDGGNEFTGSNFVPDVDILNTPYTLGKLIVNVNSIKNYIDTKMQNIPYSNRFMFNEPLILWEIVHNRNTIHYTLAIYNLAGQKMVAPVETINSNTIRIYLSVPTAGYVDMVFV